MLTPPRRRSLGFTIKRVVFGLIVATAIVSATGIEALRRVNAHFTAYAERSHALEREAVGLLTAMLNQEAGLRGYLATGERAFLEPLELGEDQEHEHLRALQIAADTHVYGGLVPALAHAITRWHRDIAEPQIRDRATGPIVDLAGKLRAGKQVFDELRGAHAHLLAAIETGAAAARAAQASDIEWIHVALVALTTLIAVLGVLATSYVVRRITRPLVELVRRAEHSDGFPPPSERDAIHEVHALATSLHRLDVAVRRREDELAHAHDEALALARFGEFAQQASTVDELHGGLERVCRSLVAPSKLTILVRNASRNRLDIAHSTAPLDPAPRHPILTEPMRCRAVRTMREVRANSDSPTACSCTLGVPERGSMLCVPMLAAGELIGVVNLQSDARDHFDAARARALHGYIGFAGGTISSLQLIAATRERALRDSLTGAHNRAFLAEYLPKTLATATRRGSQVAVLMADLDHFKRINDEHGHPVGDQAIQAFARCVQQQIRASDALVRYGGEEFAILLSEVTHDGAIATAERIRQAIAGLRLVANNVDLGPILRVSVGAALFPDHGRDLQTLVAVADAALYRAKQQGRNRVVVAEASDEQSTS
ncbi:MAG TPA: diguanylate cyclase [Kofleriaceae bacterium]|nr:diguanylate cyclase [Kofleriaceae bacterium]